MTMQPDLYYINTTNHYSTNGELTKQLKLSLDSIIDQHMRITRTKALPEILQPKKHLKSGWAGKVRQWRKATKTNEL